MKRTGPYFSVIVPTCNRPEQLDTCLGSLSRVDYPARLYEVIVVDDGGHNTAESTVATFQDAMDVTVVCQANEGPAAARNAGAHNAKGDILAFVDDDCTVAEGWLDIYAKELDEAPDAAVGGRIALGSAPNAYAVTSQMILDIVYRHYNSDPKAARFLSACNLAVPAEKFRDVGGFDTSFRISEDRELCDRWQAKGGRMVYAPEAIVHHNDYVRSFTGFCRRYFNYGRGAYRYHEIRASRGSGDTSAEVKFHCTLANWLLQPFRECGLGRASVLASLLLLWQISNATGLVYEAIGCKVGKRRR